MMTRNAMLMRGLGAVLAIGATAGCGAQIPTASAREIHVAAVGTGTDSMALVLLDRLPVKGRAPKTGYSRDEFGPAWADTDGNGCDQRDDVLARDLVEIRRAPGSACVVASGTLHDLYTGRTIPFVRGKTTSSAVQIDHVVSLSDAWQTGAQQLDAATRERLATDLDNLQAVDGPTNEAKGDGDAATWLPPNRAAWCRYAARQVTIKARYRLWVTPAERDALAGVLGNCPTAQATEAPQ
jgi:hypothetical protein